MGHGDENQAPPPAPFIFSTVNLQLEDMPLTPGTCHTPHTDELWSSLSLVLSAVCWLPHWQSWSRPRTQALQDMWYQQKAHENTYCLQKVAHN